MVNCHKVFTELLEQLDLRLSDGSDLKCKLEPLFTLPKDGAAKMQGGRILPNWVEILKEAIKLSYIHVEEMCRKAVSNEVNNGLCNRIRNAADTYKKNIILIGRIYYDIFLILEVEPDDDDVAGFKSALSEFKRTKFDYEKEIKSKLESMQSTYDQFVKEINARIDQSVTLRKQYRTQVISFNKQLSTLFLQTKKIGNQKLYDSTQLEALNTIITAIREKQQEFMTSLQNMLLEILAYSDQRIKWAGNIMKTTLPPRRQNKLGVMGF